MNKYLQYSLCLLLYLIGSSAFAQQVTEEWARKYDGQGPESTQPIGIAVDAAGNSYVTGTNYSSAGYSIVTIKYSPTGEELWVKNYTNADSNQTNAMDIAVDNAGGVYITGYIYAEASYFRYDYITIRYDAATGAQTWTQRYDSNGNDDDEVMPDAQIAVDNKGSVFVAFTITNDRTILNYDYVAIRYDAITGEEMWSSQHDVDNRFDSIKAIAVDNDGGVFVTGNNWREDAGPDITTVRFDALTGAKTWEKLFNNTFEFAVDIAADNKGGVYITGNSGGQIVTIRYDATTGNETWVSYNSGIPTALVADNHGSLFVTGYRYLDGNNQSYVTIGFDALTGTALWESSFNGGTNFGFASDIAVDNAGGVYVTGFNKGSPDYVFDSDYATVRYEASTGEETWVMRYDHNNRSDNAVAIAVDNAGGVYVSGNSNSEIATIRYEATAGGQAWVTRYSSTGSQTDVSIAITTDDQGNSYVTGRSSDAIATVKYSPAGEELWVSSYSEGFSHTAKEIVTDNQGNVFVTGFKSSLSNPDDTDIFTIRYSAETGEEIWVQTFDGEAGEGYRVDEVNAMVADSSGSIYVTGFSRFSDFSDHQFVTISYNVSTGEQRWVSRYNNGVAKAIAIDNNGGVYVTGYSLSDNGRTSDYVTIRYQASNGNQSWLSTYSGGEETNNYNRASAIAIDNQGNVYVTGTSGSFNGNNDYATIRYNASTGEEIWAGRYDGDIDIATAIAVDNIGGVFVTGTQSESTPDYGAHFATVGYDAATGEQKWLQIFDSGGNDYISALAVDNTGGVYITGSSYSYGEQTSTRYSTVKYDATNGNQLWSMHTDGIQDIATDLAIDPQGNVIVTGYSEGENTSLDYLTIKYSQQSQCPDLVEAPIEGSTTVAVGSNRSVYSLPITNATTFTWTITDSEGRMLSSFNGQGSNSITVNWPSNPGFYKLSVTYGTGENCPPNTATAYVHVFDPGAGFVTGGGWFLSPANPAYEFMQTSTKAHFGLAARYKKGDKNIVQGETHLLLENGSFYFRGDAQQARTLVIAGDHAFYRGSGTVSYRNEAGRKVTDPRRFAFLVAATDGQLKQSKGKHKEKDKLRVIIWEMNEDGSRGAVVYDNQTGCDGSTDENALACQEINGGNIKIHRPELKGKKDHHLLALEETPSQGLTAYPTAFQERTTIAFTLERTSAYTLELYDLRGALVKRIAAGTAEGERRYEHELQAGELAKGMYLVRLLSDGSMQSIKIVVQR